MQCLIVTWRNIESLFYGSFSQYVCSHKSCCLCLNFLNPYLLLHFSVIKPDCLSLKRVDHKTSFLVLSWPQGSYSIHIYSFRWKNPWWSFNIWLCSTEDVNQVFIIFSDGAWYAKVIAKIFRPTENGHQPKQSRSDLSQNVAKNYFGKRRKLNNCASGPRLLQIYYIDFLKVNIRSSLLEGSLGFCTELL